MTSAIEHRNFMLMLSVESGQMLAQSAGHTPASQDVLEQELLEVKSAWMALAVAGILGQEALELFDGELPALLRVMACGNGVLIVGLVGLRGTRREHGPKDQEKDESRPAVRGPRPVPRNSLGGIGFGAAAAGVRILAMPLHAPAAVPYGAGPVPALTFPTMCKWS